MANKGKFWNQRGLTVSNSAVKRASNFFSQKIGDLKDKAKDATMNKMSWRTAGRPQLGRMYFYAYDPKHKKTLPMYDRLPLIIPIEYYKDGWLGMNLHYLPVRMRYAFLKELMKIGGNPKLNDKAKLKLSYGLLKGAAKSRYFEPTIHRYLANHVRSNIKEVHSSDWSTVVFLPSAKWAKGKPY